jgi:hypothetical protein
MKSADYDSARTGPQWNCPAMVDGRDAGMGRAVDWNRALSLWLGQGCVDRFESPLSEQLEAGGS